MNVAASLDSEQQDQILSLAREEIEGLKASRRGSQGLVLSESKTHGVSEALWIKGTRSSTEAMWHTSNTAQCFNNVPQGPTSHSFQCCSFTDSGFDLYVRHASETSLCETLDCFHKHDQTGWFLRCITARQSRTISSYLQAPDVPNRRLTEYYSSAIKK